MKRRLKATRVRRYRKGRCVEIYAPMKRRLKVSPEHRARQAVVLKSMLQWKGDWKHWLYHLLCNRVSVEIYAPMKRRLKGSRIVSPFSTRSGLKSMLQWKGDWKCWDPLCNSSATPVEIYAPMKRRLKVLSAAPATSSPSFVEIYAPMKRRLKVLYAVLLLTCPYVLKSMLQWKGDWKYYNRRDRLTKLISWNLCSNEKETERMSKYPPINATGRLKSMLQWKGDWKLS